MVAKSCGGTPQDVRLNVMRWFDRGMSINYIKRVLIITALTRGKKLIFVSNKGTN